MNVYLTIMVTVLVATQVIRITQNHIQLFKQSKKIDEKLEWFEKNNVSERDFEIQRAVFSMLYRKLKAEEFEEPEINPCRGCEDYDGYGGCKSNGGCGRTE